MIPKKRVFLVDFDNTLFDTEKLKQEIENRLVKQFWQTYEDVIKTDGYNNVPKIAETFNKKVIEDIFYKANFKKCLLPNSLATLKNLQKLGDVKIYSLGHLNYQAIKIKGSGVTKLVGQKNVIIEENKNLEIFHEFLKNYSQIIFIDDRSEYLEKAKEIDPKIITVWLRYGKYKDVSPKNPEAINFEIYSISEIVLFNKNITNSQIDQLIKFTKADSEVQKFTHDLERFANHESYKNWIKNKKYIYTLTDNKNNLLGIIWFSKKQIPQAPDYPYTFAIRVYPPARGKGFAKSFMKMALKDFDKKKIWLATTNPKAIKIYKDLGFKEIGKHEEEILMVFENR
ncbi:MAG TPA: GNAT family N-acetyltransferase [Alphaproteobacteria bacterium]|jgi:FMN phosphatase YigB (HAD superfamily)/GNAT superfamily N-acetyltransferase|nr:GNAT family N-acetyltransferase [Alphaproteobacteria bacterium]